jgi:hypothetical protein
MISITSRATTVFLAGFLSATDGPATASPDTDTETSSIYELTVETGMPHLEENLRYATTHTRRCATLRSLFTAFPILDHPALKGCQLKDPTHLEDRLSYVLACEGGHGTTGQAVWDIDANRVRGTLNVKLGGKNMTFYQRITAVPQGRCFPAERAH